MLLYIKQINLTQFLLNINTYILTTTIIKPHIPSFTKSHNVKNPSHPSTLNPITLLHIPHNSISLTPLFR